MGWNALDIARPEHPVLAGIASGDHVYFVHSYHFAPSEPADRLATVEYGGPVAAVVARNNLVGTQFHPEKSQATGLRLLRNFLRWRP
jgi:glutamine amidotransferase